MEKIKETHPNKEILYIPDFDELAQKVIEDAEEGDLVITMGAGDIYKVGELIMDK